MIVFVSLIAIIVIHELGHFTVARIFGVAVERFSVGFGKPLLSWTSQKHFTQFTFSPILIGGFVKFSEKPFLNHQVFDEIKRWKKILILLAGPFANFLLALVLMTVVFKIDSYEPIAYVEKIYPNSILETKKILPFSQIIRCNDRAVRTWSEVLGSIQENQKNRVTFKINADNKQTTIELPNLKHKEDFFKILGFEPYVFEMPAIIGGFTPASKGQNQGLKVGDKILSIQGKKVNNIHQVSKILRDYPYQRVLIEIERNHQRLELWLSVGGKHIGQQTIGFLGITSLTFAEFPQWYKKIHYSWAAALMQSCHVTTRLFHFQLSTWFHGSDNLRQISGPIGIVKTAQDALGLSLKAYLFFVVWLNLGVGILNLLPIPILDGGQCVILLLAKWVPAIESEKIKNSLLAMSILFIFSLMLLGTFNDWINLGK